jgi:hypothetical protein
MADTIFELQNIAKSINNIFIRHEYRNNFLIHFYRQTLVGGGGQFSASKTKYGNNAKYFTTDPATKICFMTPQKLKTTHNVTNETY